MIAAPHKQLRYKITLLLDTLEKRQQERRQTRIEDIKKALNTAAEVTGNLNLSPDVATLFSEVLASIKHDEQRLYPTTTAPAPAPLIPAGRSPLGPLLQSLHEGFNATEPLLARAESKTTAAPNAVILALLQTELAILTESSQHSHVPPTLLVKLRQATQAYAEGRTTDTITVLKNALTGDPHNHTLLMCLSQVLYALAASGVNTALPEARDFAQRSIIANEKQRPARLLVYRYLAIVTERSFAEERALEWLRDCDLLSVPPMVGTQAGLLAESAIPLRAWAILGTINPLLWHESEYNHLQQLVTQVVGGAAVYMAWLRTPLLATAALSRMPMPQLDELERLFNSAHQEHAAVTPNLRQLPLKASPLPWIVRVRWLNTLTELCPAPAFDQVLCQVALDGRNWRENIYPDRDLQTLLEDDNLSCWRTWAQAITPFKDVRKPYLLPAEETLQDAELMAEADHLYALLRAAETERIKADLWPDLKPWLVRWQLEHLLATATGSNQPRNSFVPGLAPYSGFYRRWQEPQIMGLLGSEVIAEVAKRGGFASWFEVVAAFEGALRLLDDPNHGLQITQKRALKAAQKQHPAKFACKTADFGRSKGSSMGLLLAPLGFIGALIGIIATAENTSQAVGLSLALFGLAGVVMLNLSKK